MEPELERLYEVVSDYFGLLAEPTRLKILNSLCDGERSVSDIVERVGASQSNVSRHLNLMYDKGVLKRRREGQMTFYSIGDANVVTLCRTACVHLAGQLDGQSSLNRAVTRFMPTAPTD
jgi:DNA-binding transcriptional ArsR family regulator